MHGILSSVELLTNVEFDLVKGFLEYRCNAEETRLSINLLLHAKLHDHVALTAERAVSDKRKLTRGIGSKKGGRSGYLNE